MAQNDQELSTFLAKGAIKPVHPYLQARVAVGTNHLSAFHLDQMGSWLPCLRNVKCLPQMKSLSKNLFDCVIRSHVPDSTYVAGTEVFIQYIEWRYRLIFVQLLIKKLRNNNLFFHHQYVLYVYFEYGLAQLKELSCD